MRRSWVALAQNSIGGLKAGGGRELHTYLNGKKISGNPAAVEFKAHDEIAPVHGPAGQKAKVPSSYNWQMGE
ncbi:hypothetical protein ACWIGX_19035 [Streptomyces nigrescens]